MTQSITTTTARTALTTAKPKLKLAVPFFNSRKSDKPWEGLLMKDPGCDFDQRKARLSNVEYFLEMACDSGCYTKMATFYDDDDEFTPTIARRVDSTMDVSEGMQGVEKWEAEKVTKEKSIWKDPSSVWREADKTKKESQDDWLWAWVWAALVSDSNIAHKKGMRSMLAPARLGIYTEEMYQK